MEIANWIAMIIIARFVLLIQVVQPVILDILLIVNQNV